MAKPKPDFPPASALEAVIDEGGCLALRVTPGARSEGIAIADGQLTVKVRAKPQDGAANDAVVRMVAKALGVPTSRCRILRGATSRNKLLKIDQAS